MIIRRLSFKDGARFRRLRLLGQRESPRAFGKTYSEEAKLPLKTFAERLQWTADKWTFGTFEKERLVGVVTLLREAGEKEKHKASIVGMYVHPNMRGKGIGRGL